MGESNGRPKKILVVDDNRDAAQILGMLLQTLDHEVKTANDGMSAINVAKEFKPDIVLLDLGMPLMSGHETAERIRREEWGKDVTLIALTGWGQEEDKQKTKAAGFDHHLVKPVELETLEKLLH